MPELSRRRLSRIDPGSTRRLVVAMIGASLVADLGVMAFGGSPASRTRLGVQMVPPVTVSTEPITDLSAAVQPTSTTLLGLAVPAAESAASSIPSGGSRAPSVNAPRPGPGLPTPTAGPAKAAKGTARPQTTQSPPVVRTAPSAVPPCTVDACVTLDATRPTGPVDHAATGLNGGVQVGVNDDLWNMKVLDTTLYRGSPSIGIGGTYNWTAWDLARTSGAKTELILSNLWPYYEPDGTYAPPWSDWNRYANWVHNAVKAVAASGQKPDYWDIYNEPGWVGYYNSTNFAHETLDEELQQFLIAYQQIKAVLPDAAVVGPSFGQFRGAPVPYTSIVHQIDFPTFIRYIAGHGIQLAAVAWHDNGQPPSQIQELARQAWAVMDAYPQIGRPKMFLDEYGMMSNQSIPGWDVAFLSAITNGGFASAARSCWGVDCNSPSLDGLLDRSGSQTTDDFYTRLTYAAMNGQMVAESQTVDSVTGVGSVNDTGSQVIALVGRSAGCAVLSWCQSQWPGSPPPPPPAHVRVNVVVPWTAPTVNVTLSYVSFHPGQYSKGPAPATPADVTVIPAGDHGIVSFDIPRFVDGAAYNVYVTKS